ncbi:hypothetical protein F5Y16DRAFT_376888 [Xylariaceae sp. FL0255]|nr:hypothetical protein F5Y16DRAFT_376888 [Xylariaceae sp. FL0255]
MTIYVIAILVHALLLVQALHRQDHFHLCPRDQYQYIYNKILQGHFKVLQREDCWLKQLWGKLRVFQLIWALSHTPSHNESHLVTTQQTQLTGLVWTFRIYAYAQEMKITRRSEVISGIAVIASYPS